VKNTSWKTYLSIILATRRYYDFIQDRWKDARDYLFFVRFGLKFVSRNFLLGSHLGWCNWLASEQCCARGKVKWSERTRPVIAQSHWGITPSKAKDKDGQHHTPRWQSKQKT
jgi:hypothetical protein